MVLTLLRGLRCTGGLTAGLVDGGCRTFSFSSSSTSGSTTTYRDARVATDTGAGEDSSCPSSSALTSEKLSRAVSKLSFGVPFSGVFAALAAGVTFSRL